MSVFKLSKLKVENIIFKRNPEYFGSVETDRGEISYAGELSEGISALVKDASGNLIPAPDGTYQTSDGTTFDVQNGIIENLRTPSAAGNMETDVEEPDLLPAGEDATTDDVNALAETVTEIIDETDKLDDRVETLEERINALETSMSKLSVDMEQKAKPKGKPVEVKQPFSAAEPQKKVSQMTDGERTKLYHQLRQQINNK